MKSFFSKLYSSSSITIALLAEACLLLGTLHQSSSWSLGLLFFCNFFDFFSAFSDSGVKSSVSTSQNDDDPPQSPTSTDDPPLSPTSTGSDDTKKKRSILRKMSAISGMSLRSCPSSPLFDFPSFDELFEAGGKQHMALAMHQSRSGLLRQPSYPGPTVSVLGLVSVHIFLFILKGFTAKIS